MIRRMHSRAVGIIVGAMIREHVLGVEAFSSGPDDPTPVKLICRSNDVSIVASEEEIPSGPDNPVSLSFAELVQFSVSLSSFFVFCFVWPFYFIPEI